MSTFTRSATPEASRSRSSHKPLSHAGSGTLCTPGPEPAPGPGTATASELQDLSVEFGRFCWKSISGENRVPVRTATYRGNVNLAGVRREGGGTLHWSPQTRRPDCLRTLHWGGAFYCRTLVGARKEPGCRPGEVGGTRHYEGVRSGPHSFPTRFEHDTVCGMRNGAIVGYESHDAFIREVAAAYGWETAAALRSTLAEARASDDGTVDAQIARIEARQREIRERMDSLVNAHPELKTRGPQT